MRSSAAEYYLAFGDSGSNQPAWLFCYCVGLAVIKLNCTTLAIFGDSTECLSNGLAAKGLTFGGKSERLQLKESTKDGMPSSGRT